MQLEVCTLGAKRDFMGDDELVTFRGKRVALAASLDGVTGEESYSESYGVARGVYAAVRVAQALREAANQLDMLVSTGDLTPEEYGIEHINNLFLEMVSKTTVLATASTLHRHVRDGVRKEVLKYLAKLKDLPRALAKLFGGDDRIVTISSTTVAYALYVEGFGVAIGVIGDSPAYIQVNQCVVSDIEESVEVPLQMMISKSLGSKTALVMHEREVDQAAAWLHITGLEVSEQGRVSLKPLREATVSLTIPWSTLKHVLRGDSSLVAVTATDGVVLSRLVDPEKLPTELKLGEPRDNVIRKFFLLNKGGVMTLAEYVALAVHLLGGCTDASRRLLEQLVGEAGEQAMLVNQDDRTIAILVVKIKTI